MINGAYVLVIFVIRMIKIGYIIWIEKTKMKTNVEEKIDEQNFQVFREMRGNNLYYNPTKSKFSRQNSNFSFSKILILH